MCGGPRAAQFGIVHPAPGLRQMLNRPCIEIHGRMLELLLHQRAAVRAKDREELNHLSSPLLWAHTPKRGPSRALPDPSELGLLDELRLNLSCWRVAVAPVQRARSSVTAWEFASICPARGAALGISRAARIAKGRCAKVRQLAQSQQRRQEGSK